MAKKTAKKKPKLDPNGPEAQIKKHEDALRTLTDKIVMEREYRSFFQLDRDKIMAFWDISKKEIENLQAEIRNKNREKEEHHERHQVELKVYKQKLRHLLYEQKITIDRLKIESENALKLQADDFRQKMQQLKIDKRELKQETKEKELARTETTKTLKMQHDKNVSKHREEFENRLKELQIKYQTRMNQLREVMEAKARKEAEEVEERKNEQVKENVKRHDQEFQDIKNYYLIITTNNQVLIRSLKEQVASMKKNEATNEKLMFEIASENKRLSEPLSNALAEIAQLRKEVAAHERDKVSLKNTKARLLQIEDQVKTLRWEHEILENSFRVAQQERDELFTKFESIVHETQQKTLLKAQLMDTKAKALEETIEKKDAYIRTVLQAGNVSTDSIGNMKLDNDTIVHEDVRITEIHQEMEHMKRQFDEFHQKSLDTMKSYGIPFDQVSLSLPSLAEFLRMQEGNQNNSQLQ